MRWAAFFTDHEGTGAVRQQFTAEHQAFLREHKGQIILAGALRPDPDGAPAGGLWIFEAETKAEVEAIIARDPFQREGVRATSTIHAWSTAPGFEDMKIGA